MKSLKSMAIGAIVGFVTIPATMISFPLHARADEVNPSCPATSQAGVSVVGMEQGVAAIAPCHHQNASVAELQPEMQSPKQIAVTKPTSSIKQPSSQVDDFYPAYCPTLPAGLSPDDYQFRRAFERCKYSY